MPMETRHALEHTTERLTEGLRCPWKWGHCLMSLLPKLGSPRLMTYQGRDSRLRDGLGQLGRGRQTLLRLAGDL